MNASLFGPSVATLSSRSLVLPLVWDGKPVQQPQKKNEYQSKFTKWDILGLKKNDPTEGDPSVRELFLPDLDEVLAVGSGEPRTKTVQELSAEALRHLTEDVNEFIRLLEVNPFDRDPNSNGVESNDNALGPFFVKVRLDAVLDGEAVNVTPVDQRHTPLTSDKLADYVKALRSKQLPAPAQKEQETAGEPLQRQSAIKAADEWKGIVVNTLCPALVALGAVMSKREGLGETWGVNYIR